MYNHYLYKPRYSTFRINQITSTLKVVSNNNENQNANHDLTNFERLYDMYAPKALGFISKHTNSKEEAEEFMTKIFLRVWQDIKTFEKDADKKIQRIVLMLCRPLYDNKYQS